MSRHLLAALATVEHLGYTYHGGAQWKPPLGKSAEPLLDRITELKAENERLKNVAQFKEDVATTLRTQLEAAKKDAWQPIETAPKDGTRLLLIIDHGEHGDKIWTGLWADGWVVSYGKPENVPTYWMPLPSPPAIAEGKA